MINLLNPFLFFSVYHLTVLWCYLFVIWRLGLDLIVTFETEDLVKLKKLWGYK